MVTTRVYGRSTWHIKPKDEFHASSIALYANDYDLSFVFDKAIKTDKIEWGKKRIEIPISDNELDGLVYGVFNKLSASIARNKFEWLTGKMATDTVIARNWKGLKSGYIIRVVSGFKLEPKQRYTTLEVYKLNDLSEQAKYRQLDSEAYRNKDYALRDNWPKDQLVFSYELSTLPAANGGANYDQDQNDIERMVRVFETILSHQNSIFANHLAAVRAEKEDAKKQASLPDNTSATPAVSYSATPAPITWSDSDKTDSDFPF